MKPLLSLFPFVLGFALFLISALADEPKAEPEKPKAGPVSQDELMAMQKVAEESPFLLLDVRAAQEFAFGFIPGAVNAPIRNLEQTIAQGDFRGHIKQPVVVYCEAGGRAKRAIDILKEAGFQNVRPLEGDMGEWRDKKLRIAKPVLR